MASAPAPVVPVSSLAELMAALSADAPRNLELQSSVACPHSITLPPGFALVGVDRDRCILSFPNGDGIGLTRDNRIARLTVIATPAARAIYTQAGSADMGQVSLEELSVTGQVSIILRGGTRNLALSVDKLHVMACDCRRYSEQPQKYGVNVYQGALTVYNFNPDATSKITASLTSIRIGARNAPVLGSGIFVSGFGDTGGSVQLDTLVTGAVHSTGMLPFGTADIITGGVFIVYGVHASRVEHYDEIVTYGVNDMVLDAWGTVDHWIAHAPVVSYGPSGIGFVNFGTVGDFIAEAAVVTHGPGARGFNQYDGTIRNARFKSIETFGDGSIGIQVSKPVGTITIDGNVTTHGTVGETLVKGVIMQLPADAISVKPGGVVERLVVGGNLETHGAGVTTYAVEGGKVEAIDVRGEVVAHGQKSEAIRIDKGGATPLTNVTARAPAGNALTVADGEVSDRTGFAS